MPSILNRFECAAVCLFAGAFAASAWAVDRRVPDDFPSIQAAISAAGAGDRILIGPGEYIGNITLKSDIELIGEITALTTLRPGTGGGAVLRIDNLGGITIRNLTFSGGSTGIEIIGGTNIEIRNNVFALGNQGTGISIDDVSEADIRHNTFHGNAVAVERDSDAPVIKNNIFSANTSNVVTDGSSADDDNVSFNCAPADPEYADADALDFHLRAGSDCIDAADDNDPDDAFDNTDPDAGAYGGPDADVVSFPVGRPSAEVNESATNTSLFDVTLNWERNLSYLTADYRIYYDSDRSGRPYDGDDAASAPSGGSALTSPFEVGDETASSVTLFNLLSNPAMPQAPELLEVAPSNRTLDVRWSAVDGATAYRVEYGVASADENSVDVGNVTAHEITGLENGATYRVRVSALNQTTYFFAVSVLGTPVADGSPDIEETESPLSPELSVRVGPAQESAPSNELTGIPEEIQPFPVLPDQEGAGCFIATAAYGHFSHPQVQLLRDFRDRFLLTNSPGRAFTDWYYRHSPAAAAFIAERETLRMLTRWALLPLIGLAWLMLHAFAPALAALTLCAVLAAVLARRIRVAKSYHGSTIEYGK